MIDLIFNFASDVVLIRITNHEVKFANSMFGAVMADISGIRLDYAGTIREFPDLKDDIEWREKAIERFKAHIKSLDSEDKISDYIISELKSKGYTPRLKQIAGFRAVKIT